MGCRGRLADSRSGRVRATYRSQRESREALVRIRSAIGPGECGDADSGAEHPPPRLPSFARQRWTMGVTDRTVDSDDEEFFFYGRPIEVSRCSYRLQRRAAAEATPLGPPRPTESRIRRPPLPPRRPPGESWTVRCDCPVRRVPRRVVPPAPPNPVPKPNGARRRPWRRSPGGGGARGPSGWRWPTRRPRSSPRGRGGS